MSGEADTQRHSPRKSPSRKAKTEGCGGSGTLTAPERGTPGKFERYAAGRICTETLQAADASVVADKSKDPKRPRLQQSALPVFEGRRFFLDRLSGGWQPDEYVTRLRGLGAIVEEFLDADVDCVVTPSAGTPSAPSTPTDQTAKRGISVRAIKILNSKSLGIQHTTPAYTTPAQFAKKNRKQLLSPKELDARLTAVETCQEQQKLKKRARPKTRPDEASGTGKSRPRFPNSPTLPFNFVQSHSWFDHRSPKNS